MVTRFIADFHIHSKYSHATSKYMDLVSLSTWGQLKGVGVMGTGDFTHPVWQQELKNQLMPAEQGLFQLRPEFKSVADGSVYDSCKGQDGENNQRFMLSAEISTVFKRNGRCYRTHTILLAPSFEVVDVITKALAKIGNIASDGRPILGCDVKDLAKIVLNASPDCMLIPAHIWTPWYGLLGSKSGFNSVQECFEELTDYIFAVEKGLSSSMLMNAQVSELDRFSVLCNSDAHSMQNLGREANMMQSALSYEGITSALRKNDRNGLVSGIEFFPERGKYYGDGHRACWVYLTPEQTRAVHGICPVCCKPVTVGVLNRVSQLADRTVLQAESVVRKSLRVVPLLDIVSQQMELSDSSQKVQKMYHQILQRVGPEFFVLLEASTQDIEKASTSGIAHAIAKLRVGDVIVTPGYDGVYGKIEF